MEQRILKSTNKIIFETLSREAHVKYTKNEKQMKIKWKGILECNMDMPHNWPLKSFIKKENICSQFLEIEWLFWNFDRNKSFNSPIEDT